MFRVFEKAMLILRVLAVVIALAASIKSIYTHNLAMALVWFVMSLQGLGIPQAWRQHKQEVLEDQAIPYMIPSEENI